MTNCNHELFCQKEEWISNNEVRVEMKCDLCNSKFEGVIKKYD